MMKIFPLTILCLVASLSPSAYSASLFKGQEKVIYHQTMTPNWLEAHASYMDSFRSTTTEQLTFNAGSSASYAALLKVPMIPAGILQYSAPLTVKIVFSHDVSIGTTQDSDISYGVSDGVSFIGFDTHEKGEYGSHAPCFGYEGTSGTTLTGRRYISHSSPRPSDKYYPGQFAITLKLDEHWGSCFTAHDGGFLKTAVYSNRLMLNKGLTLEVYKQDKGERVGIKYVEVTVLQDA
ncbi:uncharacterized protein LOC144663764 isoform X3 [Oculina patagonica]